MNLLKDCCKACKFFDPWDEEFRRDDDEEHGVCRRHPPQVVGTPNDEAQWDFAFPNVSYENWCGEFKPKESL